MNVRSAERRFLDEFLVMLADGFKMRKHGRRGGPKDRLVRLDGDMIVWTAVRPSFPVVRARWRRRGGRNGGATDLRGAPEAGERSGGSLPVADFQSPRCGPRAARQRVRARATTAFLCS